MKSARKRLSLALVAALLCSLLVIPVSAASSIVRWNASYSPVAGNTDRANLPAEINEAFTGDEIFLNVQVGERVKFRETKIYIKEPSQTSFYLYDSETARNYLRYSFFRYKIGSQTGKLKFYFQLTDVNGKTRCTPETTLVVHSRRVQYVEHIKPSTCNTIKDGLKSLEYARQISQEVFACDAFLRSVGLAAGSVSSGFATAAMNISKDPDLIIGVSQLEIARYFVQKAYIAGERALSYENQKIDEKNYIHFLTAYRDYCSCAQAARAILNDILDDYKEIAEKPVSVKVAFLSQKVFDGALDGVMGGLKDVEECGRVACTLIGIRDNTQTVGSFVDSAFSLYSAYNTYWEVYNKIENMISNANSL